MNHPLLPATVPEFPNAPVRTVWKFSNPRDHSSADRRASIIQAVYSQEERAVRSRRERQRRWRAGNKAKIAAKNKRYQLANMARLIEYRKAYYRKNREAIRLRRKRS